MTPQERSSLIDALLDGDISEADTLRIEAELSIDPAVRMEYYRRLQLDMLLQRAAATHHESMDHAPSTDAVQQRPIATPPMWSLIAAAAAVLLAVVIAPSIRSMLGRAESTYSATASPGDESIASGFGILGGQTNAKWREGRFAKGDLLPAGRLGLKSGLAHIELFSGVELVIRGNAEFSIDSPMQVTLHRGRARAHVPEPASGFRIKTAGGDVVDLGTEFTVDVDQSDSKVLVHDGEVELHRLQSDVEHLHDGERSSWMADGRSVEDRAFDDDLDLIGPLQFSQELAASRASRLAHWQARLNQICESSDVVAYYQMTPQDGHARQLANLANVVSGDTQEVASEAAIVAAGRSVDRWGRGNSAVDLSRLGSRIRVDVPGEYRSLTMLCWVRIHSLDRLYNSLFLTDGHEAGEPHWQILRDGRLFFSVKHPIDGEPDPQQGIHRKYISSPFWDASRCGRWTMLGVVYDPVNHRVTHYVDGAPIDRLEIADDVAETSIRMGTSSIGNWSEPMYREDPEFVIRNLNGSIDEFILLSTALSSDDVQSLYEAGNPSES
ncbi:MAG: FecR domain-containing protein [Planctomycetota bacterium]